MSSLPVPYYYNQFTAKERSYIDYMGEINKSIDYEIESNTNKSIVANGLYTDKITSTIIDAQIATEKAISNNAQEINRTLNYGFSDVSRQVNAIDNTVQIGFTNVSKQISTMDNTMRTGFSDVSRQIGVMNASMNMAFASLNSTVQESAQTICDRLDIMNNIMNNPSLTKSRELFRRASVNYNKGFYDEAIEDLLQAISSNKTDYISWFLLGKTYLFGAGEFSTVIDLNTAIESFKNAVKYITPDAKTHGDARLMAAEICFFLGLAEQTKAMDILHAENIKESKDYLELAEKSYRQSWNYSSQMLESLYNRARCNALLGDVQNVLIDLRTIIPKDISYYFKIIADSDFFNLKEIVNDAVDKLYNQITQGMEIRDNVLVKYSGYDENIVIPPPISCIGENAFRDCNSLANITISPSVIYIKKFAFLGCINLSNIFIPSSVINIEKEAFFECTNLKNITLSRQTKIGDSAFPSDCKIIYVD